ncbi:MAG: S41 family peptidase, partial [Proteobacteria bacterium]|nr:S41 family peptidase [Pseudomonadota bacterium]
GKMVRRLVLGATALFFASCSLPPSSGPSNIFSRDDTAALFSAGLDTIRLYYVEEPDIPRMVLRGLNGLAELDPEFHAERDGEAVTLIYRNARVATLAAPPDNDVVRWSYLTAAALETARLKSPDIAATDLERTYQAVFNAALAELDRFSRYQSAKDAQSSRAHRQGYSGIGISLGNRDEIITVREVFEDTPAAEAGLQIGDSIHRVDGVVVIGWPLDKVAPVLRGSAGSQVNLTLVRNKKTLAVSLIRREVIEQTVFTTLTDNSAVIRVTGFNEQTSLRMREHIDTATETLGDSLNGVVLDLRGNRGGMLDEAVNLADLFMPNGTILTTVGRHDDAQQNFRAEPDDNAERLPLVVLIDSGSASASEVVAAALQDSGRGLLIGARSYGKGSVQRVRDLPNNGALNLTWATMRAPSGYTLSRFGVFPTICTGGEGAAAPAMLEQIRRGEVLDANLGPLRRIAESLDPLSQSRLLQRCADRPRAGEAEDIDLDLALGLLAEPALYKRITEYAMLAMQRQPGN